MERLYKTVETRGFGKKIQQFIRNILLFFKMRNPKMDAIIEIVDDKDEFVTTGILNNIEKSSFHDFIDEFEGELVIRHLEGNKYMLRIKNADLIQTKKKLYPEISET